MITAYAAAAGAAVADTSCGHLGVYDERGQREDDGCLIKIATPARVRDDATVTSDNRSADASVRRMRRVYFSETNALE